MPQLGESVTEGTIEKWLVKPGDIVNKYDPLAEVNTDKVTAEIPSSFSGKIVDLVANEGETLDVGSVVCTIEVEGDGDNPADVQVGASPAKPEPANEMPAAGSLEPSSPLKQDKKEAGRFSPAVLRLAQENDIDLSLVEGTGRGGRITRKDLLAIIESGVIPKAPTQEVTSASPTLTAQPTQTVQQPADRKSVV